jgi:molybdenum cofactor cytidylyltransferase
VLITCVVLAAGSSSRLGRPKQLLQIEGEPLVRRAARVAREVAQTVVVIPANAPEIRAALADLDVSIVENAGATEGIASSIRCGVAAAPTDVLLMVCDQPRITSQHLRALIDADALIAATGYAGAAGVPARFSARLRDELLELRGDVGARSLIERHREAVAIVPFEDAKIDIDVAEDVRKLM